MCKCPPSRCEGCVGSSLPRLAWSTSDTSRRHLRWPNSWRHSMMNSAALNNKAKQRLCAPRKKPRRLRHQSSATRFRPCRSCNGLRWPRTTSRGNVELGRYLCEVRAGQYWRVDNVRSFDEFLERKFPESRRKAYYLMAIHEHLTPIRKRELELIGWTKARELAKVARRDRQGFDCAPWVHKATTMPSRPW